MAEGRDVDWDVALRAGRTDPAAVVEVAATDPLYVLYTSGTTGKPKGIVRDNGGHAVAMAWSLPAIYGCGAGDVWWAASDVGWVVGHSYIVYAPLIAGATTVLYEGKPVGTPDAGRLLAGDRRAPGQGPLHRPHRDPGDQEGGPGRRVAGRARHLLAARPSSSPASGSTRTPRSGRPRPPRGAGGRQLVADRDRLADRCQPARPGAAADQAGLAVGAGAGLRRRRSSTTDGRAGRPRARRAPSACASRCPRARCRRCGATTTASSPPTSPPSTATTSPATAATSTRTATSTSWGAPTTSSTSPVTGSRPGRWRR